MMGLCCLVQLLLCPSKCLGRHSEHGAGRPSYCHAQRSHGTEMHSLLAEAYISQVSFHYSLGREFLICSNSLTLMLNPHPPRWLHALGCATLLLLHC